MSGLSGLGVAGGRAPTAGGGHFLALSSQTKHDCAKLNGSNREKICEWRSPSAPHTLELADFDSEQRFTNWGRSKSKWPFWRVEGAVGGRGEGRSIIQVNGTCYQHPEEHSQLILLTGIMT
jgi:hypothetical protein